MRARLLSAVSARHSDLGAQLKRVRRASRGSLQELTFSIEAFGHPPDKFAISLPRGVFYLLTSRGGVAVRDV